MKSELLKKIKWQRILDSGGSLTPLELIYLEAIDYVSEYTWSGWQGIGLDVHSDTSWTNPYPFSSTISDYMTPESLRGQGTDLSSLATQYPEIMYDILGNPRTGAWDIGALEYVSGVTPPNTTGKLIKDKNGKIIRDKNGKLLK